MCTKQCYCRTLGINMIYNNIKITVVFMFSITQKSGHSFSTQWKVVFKLSGIVYYSIWTRTLLVFIDLWIFGLVCKEILKTKNHFYTFFSDCQTHICGHYDACTNCFYAFVNLDFICRYAFVDIIRHKFGSKTKKQDTALCFLTCISKLFLRQKTEFH